MARFDEEANINWAERLEEAGAQVVYGVVGLKTHAKMALVLRREPNGLRRYAHLGTGNYNPTTAKFYTDFGMLTSDDAVTADVNEVFIHLTSLTRPTQLATVWLAPFSLQKEIVKAIRQEAAIAREGKPGRIIAKMNSLTDESVIRALYEASNDGVRIDLIVRGACALRPACRGCRRTSRCVRSSAASWNTRASSTSATSCSTMST
jgi:polyphosphate kinase